MEKNNGKKDVSKTVLQCALLPGGLDIPHNSGAVLVARHSAFSKLCLYIEFVFVG